MARGAKGFASDNRYEVNVIILCLFCLATLAFTWSSHKSLNNKIEQSEHLKLKAELCRGGDEDSCDLEFKKVEKVGKSLLLENSFVSKISKPRSLNCSLHGFEDADRECQCPILYKGKDCSKTFSFLVRLPNAWKLQAEKVFSTRSFTGMFDGKFIMSQNGFPAAKDKRHVYEQVSIEKYNLNGDGSVQRRREVIGFVDKPLYDILPESDPLRERVFNRCAVVGNSGVLLNRQGGEIIDNYHMVIRLNQAPTIGFSRHVGSKTTLRLVHVDHMDFQEDDESVVVTGLSRDMLRDRKWFVDKGFGKKNRLLLLDPEFENYVAKSAVEFKPSQGTLGALLAMQVCRQVHLYGFFMWERHGDSPFHYFDTCGREVTEQEEAEEDLEWRFLKSLAVGKLLSFGETCVLECRDSEEACESCRQNDPTYEPLVPGDVLELRRKHPKPPCVESEVDYQTQSEIDYHVQAEPDE